MESRQVRRAQMRKEAMAKANEFKGGVIHFGRKTRRAIAKVFFASDVENADE